MSSESTEATLGLTEPLEIHDLEPTAGNALDEVVGGLSRPQKRLPCKLFYDERGSHLFDQICELPEYYLTRTEKAILRAHAGEMGAAAGESCRLVEFGAGSGIKTRILLNALSRPSSYVPIDISREHLLAAASAIARDYPHLRVTPLIADYTRPFELPDPSYAFRSTCAFFPGSTLGNFAEPEALDFLARIAVLVGADGGLIIGIDLRKDRRVLEQAYNDAAGVTAAFNLNALEVVNRRLDADFDPSRFEHLAVYDDRAGRIEMRLVSLCDQAVHIKDREFRFTRGEYIVTEHAHKYHIDGFAELAGRAGFEIKHVWCDAERLFGVCHLRVNSTARQTGKARR